MAARSSRSAVHPLPDVPFTSMAAIGRCLPRGQKSWRIELTARQQPRHRRQPAIQPEKGE